MPRMRHRTARSNFILLTTAVAALATGCTHPHIRTLGHYRDAKKRGDYVTAATYMDDDARIWFGEKKGPGAPLRPKGGPYKDWDKEFNAKSTREKAEVRGSTVTYISREINDFYRLTDRQPTPARVTYYFNDDGKIAGMLYKGLSSKQKRPPDRFDEFKGWADARYPGLLDSAEMNIPNNTKRWRELLTEWRADVGLPVVD